MNRQIQNNPITPNCLNPGYRRIAWLESTGKEYIDTGYAFTHTNMRIINKHLVWNLDGNPYFAIQEGASMHSGRQLHGCLWMYRCYVGDGYVNSSFARELNTDTVIEYVFKDGVAQWYKNGSLYFTYNGYNNWKGTDYNDSVFYKDGVGCRIYYHKMFDENDVMVRYFIPCYRCSDNALGMLDMVEKKFYTNAGTGEFIAGPVL